MKILVVDDSITIRKIIRSNLERFDITTILEAQNGMEAFSSLQKHRDIDLVILDHKMPIMTGLELVKKALSDKSLKETKIIVVTAETDSKLIDEFRRYGITRFIFKPFNLESFCDMIRPMLGVKSDGSKDELKVGISQNELSELFKTSTPSVKMETSCLLLDFGSQKLSLPLSVVCDHATHMVELE